MRRRVLLLVAALVVAMAGTLSILAYVARLDARATAEERVTRVLVATALVPAGTSGAEAAETRLVELRDFPTRLVPQGALTGVDVIRDSVSASDLQPGEVIVGSDFVSRRLAGTMEIPEDNVAITIKVGDFQRVADFVKPGLEVAVLHSFPMPPSGAAAEGSREAEPRTVTDLLLPRVKVLAIGPTAASVVGGAPAAGTETQQEEPASLVTLSVTIEDAARVVHAQQMGQGGGLYLTLLTDRSNTELRVPASDATFLDRQRLSTSGPATPADSETATTEGA